MSWRHISIAVGILAGCIWAGSAIGYSIVGISGIMEHFSGGQPDYWQARLLASQLIGTTLFALIALLAFSATYFYYIRQNMLAGRLLFGFVIAAGVVTIGELLLLTPQDASHTIPFVLSTILAAISAVAPSKAQ